MGPMLSFAIALILSAALVALAQGIRSILPERHDAHAVQASHVGNPLRLGGVAVFFAVVAAAMTDGVARDSAHAAWLLLSALPVLAAGWLEDSGYLVSARARFLASIIAAVVAILALGVHIDHVSLPPIDMLLQVAPLAILTTVLFAAVFCHAVNLIDGMNGLAAVVSISAALGMGFVAAQQGLDDLSGLAFVLAAAIGGFGVMNWPISRLFLGDAGSYGIGHLLVWLGISIAAFAPDVAKPAILLILFWPIADTMHTVLRRLAESRSMFTPDRMHLHQKIRRGIEIVFLGAGRKDISNPLTTLLMAPFIAAPVLAGVLLAEQPLAAWIVLGGCFAAFSGAHVLVTQLARLRRRHMANLGNAEAHWLSTLTPESSRRPGRSHSPAE